MITLSNVIINNTSIINEKICCENVNFKALEKIDKKDIYQKIRKKIKINNKDVTITFVVDKNNNILIPSKIKKNKENKNKIEKEKEKEE